MNIVSTNKLLFDIEFNDKNCDSILIEKLPNDDTMRIVVARETALCEGLYPYVETEQYRRSLDYNPDVVIIKLGTNDANHRNDKWRANFGHDYRKLVDVYRNLPSRPRVILMTPVRCFLQSNQVYKR